MAIVAKSADNGTFVNAPQGSHQAVCCDVIDVGPRPVSGLARGAG